MAYYTSFRIQNFKGIKDTTIYFDKSGRANVYAFVGLNESGKTTILEAIHSFSPERATSELIGGSGQSGVPFTKRVPRHLISEFSGQVSVEATIKLDESEKDEICDELTDESQIVVDRANFPEEMTLRRYQVFQDGDFKDDGFCLDTPLSIKRKKQKRFRAPDMDEADIIRDCIYNWTPDIAYFPTFIFDFPEKIFLTDRGGRKNQFYKKVFQDILDYDGRGHTIEKSIVRRIRSEDKVVPWMDFYRLWNEADDKEKIQQVMDRASAVVTKVVFGRWNQIFHEEVKGKELIIGYGLAEGERQDQTGAVQKSNEHDIYIEFKIKDGSRRFEVNSRSLGFRWFFAFMLFTQFRVAREASRPVLFLFDEPASNLHPAAQQKLLDSFPEIAKGGNVLGYTTHSHYMIEPKWLEQTFIVTNRSDAPSESVMDGVSLDDESLDIQACRYRTFIGMHPDKTSYFKPILDRLEVVPSRFDIDQPSIVVEGKSDYYILRAAAGALGRDELALLPGMGAGTFGALVSLCVGWNLQMLFLLDGDKAGQENRERYVREYGLPASSAVLLSELNGDVVVVEDILDKEATDLICNSLELTRRPSKKEVSRFFQECLASGQLPKLGRGFETRASSILDKLKERLVALDS